MSNKKSFESQLTRLSLIASLPLFFLTVGLMIYADISIYIVLLTVLLSSISIVFCHSQIHRKSAYQFRSLSNILEAMIQGDYTLRAHAGNHDLALKELIIAINTLAERLNKQRLESVESQLLLRTVIDHIDVAIIALNDNNELMFFNPAAKKLLQLAEIKTDENELNIQLAQLAVLECGENKVMPLSFSGQYGKFNIHMEEFREEGKQRKLFFITNVSNMLRSEEQNAWQSLVRVLSHEINNSLSPINSISQTLKRFLDKHENIQEHKEDLLEGLGIIAQRSNNLKEFVNSYKQISHLPKPKKHPSSLKSLVEKVTKLFHKNTITVATSQDLTLFIDAVQIEQVLINLMKNAVEAIKAAGTAGEIVISWQVENSLLVMTITDDGVGIANDTNMFVPFYTTKKQGSGIGLVFCRQIVEAHNGELSLTNRLNKQGCKVTLKLPLSH
ncbi:sensor histidine kinase [Cognaticolwellia mytili]|uniref:sensor histidine kinase n=1 Tax=Cognaticolwellia mytili TaxID=1888913 RepID=UPI00117F0740|nr:ATP-binding protein [Cognaticolwellia mytili]